MQFVKNNLITLLVIAGCGVVLFVYESYFASTPSDSSVLVSNTATSSAAGVDLLVSINALQAVNLDASIFSDPVFASLVDFGVIIPPEPVGRNNPFAPLGSVSSNSSIQPTNITTSANTTAGAKKPK